MGTILEDLRSIFTEAMLKAFPGNEDFGLAEVMEATNEKFGHYQFNSALKLAKILKKTPLEIAKKIAENLDNFDEDRDILFDHIEVLPPGFINITFSKAFLSKRLNLMLKDERLGIPKVKDHKKVIVEFSSPNIAKELHVGHLRSTIIGDCLARVLEFLGYNVLRLSHVGDWGTQFGMLIAYLKENAPEVCEGSKEVDLTQLTLWYKAAKKLFDEDSDFKRRAQLQVVELQSGEPTALKTWQIICAISRKAYQEIYDLLDVKLQERGESFYNSRLASTVEEIERKGLVTISDGARCVFLEGFKNREGEPLPVIIQKSDGGYNYDTTDLAAVRHRIEDEKADWIIVVTDAGQILHFQMIFEIAKKAGYWDENKVRIDHVPFGLVLGEDHKKFKTRSGDTEKLIDLLHEAVDRSKAILEERGVDLPEKDLNQLSKTLGISAVKYADLSSHRMKDYVFSYDRMLRFEGNTAAFLLYAYVRIQGIKRKIGKDLAKLIETGEIKIEHESEANLALCAIRFEDRLHMLLKDLLPNRLAEFLYELAEKFNAFFRDCRVEGSENENSRLLICELTGRILKKGLYLLGINTVDRM